MFCGFWFLVCRVSIFVRRYSRSGLECPSGWCDHGDMTLLLLITLSVAALGSIAIGVSSSTLRYYVPCSLIARALVVPSRHIFISSSYAIIVNIHSVHRDDTRSRGGGGRLLQEPVMTDISAHAGTTTTRCNMIAYCLLCS